MCVGPPISMRMTHCHRRYRVSPPITHLVAVALAVCAFLSSPVAAQSAYEQEPINYNTAAATDPVARLQAEIDSGRATLDHDDRHGYLASLLARLNVPVSSQTLVFSKTSFQREQIAPETPRALYFNDDSYVGWVQGGDMLEVASADPNLGTVFYTLDQRKASEGVRPRFVRQTDSCLQCHGSTMTDDVPGLLVRSVHTDPTGMPVLTAGTALVTQETPLEQRWGGWYVTGTHGEHRHKGNVVARHRDDDGPLDVEAGANRTDLSGRFDPSRYLGGGHSDIVALMVREHQAEAHNLLTKAGFQARWAMRDSQAINDALGTSGGELTDSARRRIHNAGERLVKYLLFCDEELLTDRIAGTSTFAADFAARGPRDSKGRSLRDLDLRKRMFRYPLSYLVYSAAFEGLPAPVKDHVYRRLFEVLSGQDRSKAFSHLSTDDRRAVLEILRETKPDLPEYFKGPEGAS